MDDALELVDYLPMSFKTEEETDYIESLWQSFINNYENEDYHSAVMSFHMLFMSFVYCVLWKIKNHMPDDVEKIAIGFGKDTENRITKMESPYAFSAIPERSVFRFLRLIECGNDKIGMYAKLVDVRNDIAHADGNVHFRTQTSIDGQIRETLRATDEIQSFSRKHIERVYMKFLMDCASPTLREYLDDEDQIREVLVRGNYMSSKDIETCRAFEILKLSYDARFEEEKTAHEVLIRMYGDESISS